MFQSTVWELEVYTVPNKCEVFNGFCAEDMPLASLASSAPQKPSKARIWGLRAGKA